MRIISLILISLVFLTSCGGSAPGTCAGLSFLGNWYNSGTTETIGLTEACRFTSDVCSSTGSFPPVTGSSGTVLITVDSTGGAGGCLPLGAATCAFAVDTAPTPDTLTIDCGGGAIVYEKQ